MKFTLHKIPTKHIIAKIVRKKECSDALDILYQNINSNSTQVKPSKVGHFLKVVK